MSETKIESQEFQGKLGKISAFLMTPSSADSRLAVVLPGAGYSFRQPLLHFATQVLLIKRFRVLVLDKIYGDDPAWKNLKSEQDARRIVEEDAVGIFREIPTRFGTQPHTILARSLGTYAVACGLEHQVAQPRQVVWQTPALGSKWPIMRNCGIRSLGILGTADYYYEQAFPNLPDDRILIDGADHAMEIPGKPIESINVLKQVTQATSDWIGE